MSAVIKRAVRNILAAATAPSCAARVRMFSFAAFTSVELESQDISATQGVRARDVVVSTW